MDDFARVTGLVKPEDVMLSSHAVDGWMNFMVGIAKKKAQVLGRPMESNDLHDPLFYSLDDGRLCIETGFVDESIKHIFYVSCGDWLWKH